MNKVKYLSVVLFAAILAGVLISCGDNGDKDDPIAEAKAAGVEAGELMCACVASYEEPNPADYLPDMEALQAAFQEYYGQLYACLGVIVPYAEYAALRSPNEPVQTDDPLLAVFIFHNEHFREAFVEEGVKDCYDTFMALWALMQ